MGDGKRLSDGGKGLRYPYTALDTRLLKYPFTIPYLLEIKRKLISGGLDKYLL